MKHGIWIENLSIKNCIWKTLLKCAFLPTLASSYDTHRRTIVLRFNWFCIEISQYNYIYVAIFIAVICSGIVGSGRIYWDYLLFIWTSHSWPETNWEADCREKKSHKSPVIILPSRVKRWLLEPIISILSQFYERLNWEQILWVAHPVPSKKGKPLNLLQQNPFISR